MSLKKTEAEKKRAAEQRKKNRQGLAHGWKYLTDKDYYRETKAKNANKTKLKAGQKKTVSKIKDLKGSMRERMRAQNVERHGTKAIKKLESKGADFKKMRSGKMTQEAFVKRYPNSITARNAASKRKKPTTRRSRNK
jgi:hypothetical protein